MQPPLDPVVGLAAHSGAQPRAAHGKPADIHQYDLLLNSSLLGEDVCADLIAQAARAKEATFQNA